MQHQIRHEYDGTGDETEEAHRKEVDERGDRAPKEQDDAEQTEEVIDEVGKWSEPPSRGCCRSPRPSDQDG